MYFSPTAFDGVLSSVFFDLGVSLPLRQLQLNEILMPRRTLILLWVQHMEET